jgi:hypothetical protein
MNKLTGKEIIELFKKSGIGVRSFAYNETTPWTDQEKDQWRSVPYGTPLREELSIRFSKLAEERTKDLPKYIEADQYGGEGQGDTWFSIKYFEEHDVYLKVSGWYQSHYGTDFSDWDDAVKEVKPQEKTITVYE